MLKRTDEEGPNVLVVLREDDKSALAVRDWLHHQGVTTFTLSELDLVRSPIWSRKDAQECRVALFLVGEGGWRQEFIPLAEEARLKGLKTIVVDIDRPAGESSRVLPSMGFDHTYMEVRGLSEATMYSLLQLIRSNWPRALRDSVARIFEVLVGGEDEARLDALRLIARGDIEESKRLANELRDVLADDFSPRSEASRVASGQDAIWRASARSWMLSALVWADGRSRETQELILRHLDESYEADRNVRFWILAALYQSQAEYREFAASNCVNSDNGEVALLAAMVGVARARDMHSFLERKLKSGVHQVVWETLRALRIVPAPALAHPICDLLERALQQRYVTYEVFLALSHQSVAKIAVPYILQRWSVRKLVGVLLRTIKDSKYRKGVPFIPFIQELPASETSYVLKEIISRDRESAFVAQHLLSVLDPQAVASEYVKLQVVLNHEQN